MNFGVFCLNLVLLQTPVAYEFYMLEEKYVKQLVTKGKISQYQSNIDSVPRKMCTAKPKEAVGHCNALLQSTSISLKDAYVALKSTAYDNIAIGSKVDRIGNLTIACCRSSKFTQCNPTSHGSVS